MTFAIDAKHVIVQTAMGEIAEMMLNGTLCEGCGVFLNAKPPGHPCYCSNRCRKDRGADAPKVPGKPTQPKVKCSICGRKVKAVGLTNHMKDAHPPNGKLDEK